ncbi:MULTISPECIES: (d)CMP kinase [Fictibacillus]|uniref:Cytidylate kinase n=1 Tax=Fictibacillus enclensis TaxID=1017270 RepID=A0A0V8JEV9_9BACL|nr:MULTISPECIES: (d)CMP kinase [Fictibacillus]KSU85598.1 cytidylate kinase [Fictibacillus enclensis]RXY98707.1 (d)CMP kinase [Fictibacillus sp. S7]SCB99467.1 cytidylate kinase [Fictibacillus enclensis]
MNKKLKIAIDGPAGAGKSTVAKLVADQLSYIYIDTGAMYRALTYKALKTSSNLHDGSVLQSLLKETEIELEITDAGQAVILDGRNVSEEIRSAEVTNNVSFVATPQEVREEMVRRQQKLAAQGGVVMDGRDIGTHVMPDAELKVFLVASVEERAKRRYEENRNKGYETSLEQLKEEISLRDKRDSEREFAPLKKADDAIELDTTSMSIQDVVNEILHLVSERAE